MLEKKRMKSVLIVDDEKEIRSIFEEIFRYELGFESITFAQDGKEAYAICSTHKFDVITLDHMMPQMKGGEFLTALRNMPGLNQKTPVIMISAHLPKFIEKEGNSSHENTVFMDKPIDFNHFSKFIKATLEADSE